ncbi:hypothetical protein NCC78_18585 [Micromonospora phytophila]|uniref:hypothetical protein n=1 Tax=Micromonospora phytophila TaxID=709888 RepID=UPI0020307FF9|nr:hypothetical protein [Micromonospora phytophila]MCM0676678.1 hypothetical protein [Micromonospora phytophila]
MSMVLAVGLLAAGGWRLVLVVLAVGLLAAGVGDAGGWVAGGPAPTWFLSGPLELMSQTIHAGCPLPRDGFEQASLAAGDDLFHQRPSGGWARGEVLAKVRPPAVRAGVTRRPLADATSRALGRTP